MNRRFKAAHIVVLLSMVAFASSCSKGHAKPIDVATTPAIASTGLVQELAKSFTAQGGPDVNLRVVPLDEVFRLAESHAVQVMITNSPKDELRFVQSGKSKLYSRFAFDEVVILGPDSDPANARHARSAVDALQRIVSRKRRFCSPTDVPELREIETALWSAAAVDPSKLDRHSDCGGDPAAALHQAAKIQAYTISTRSTVENEEKSLSLKVLHRDDPLLFNGLASILVDGGPNKQQGRDAEWFVEWLSSFQARDLIQSYRTPDGRHFFVHSAARN